VRPRILVTPGDPRGIGPEVALRALDALSGGEAGHAAHSADLVLVGPDGPVSRDDFSLLVADACRGATDASAGHVAAASIERAVELAVGGGAHAIVTAPLHKPSLRAAGWRVPGQTEMLQALTAAPRVGMLMAAEETRLGPPLRVLLATTHIPLADVPSAVTEELLRAQLVLLDIGLRRDWGLAEPRIALCGMNPHASDGGLFGREEIEVFAPALALAREDGVTAEGPFPADTVFGRALAGEFDAVVAPYHDVGMAAFKTVSFGSGVNVTIGLPFVRTSPDHGTAFDIAGTDRASPTSMIEAIRLARTLARNRFDTDSAAP
jgi:4-hydroxythreonine-4-phosphate dehydrogenase